MSVSRRRCLQAGLVTVAATVFPGPSFSGEGGRPLRVGLWGCNSSGLALAVSALRGACAVELRVIADPDPARAARAANWWRHPAHRPTVRERIRIGAAGVISGPAADRALARWPLDALLLADPGNAPPGALMHTHACVLPVALRPALLSWLRLARERAEADGHVLKVCAPALPATHARAGADLRAESLAEFFGAIRQGRG